MDEQREHVLPLAERFGVSHTEIEGAEEDEFGEIPLEDFRQMPVADYDVRVDQLRAAIRKADAYYVGSAGRDERYEAAGGSDAYLDAIKESVIEHGLKQPILVRAGEHGMFVHDGTHRSVVVHELEIDPVPVRMRWF